MVVKIIGAVQMRTHIIGLVFFSCLKRTFRLHKIDILSDFVRSYRLIQIAVGQE